MNLSGCQVVLVVDPLLPPVQLFVLVVVVVVLTLLSVAQVDRIAGTR